MNQNADYRFEFGKNWLDFIKKNFSWDKVEASKNHILQFLKLESLDGLCVLDIGCGSGLHSIAMLKAGAKMIHSFDYDFQSIAATRYVQSQVDNAENWIAEQGSILDDRYMASLPEFDLVYCWGVLHHTGNVWSALLNSANKVKHGGYFYVALYSADVQIDPTPQFWLDVKKKYVSSRWPIRRLMEIWYIWRFMLNRNLLYIPMFLRRMREHKKNRGMNIFTDIRDWLGGWPMDFLYDADVIKFCKDLDLKLENIKTGEACTEFLFVRH